MDEAERIKPRCHEPVPDMRLLSEFRGSISIWAWLHLAIQNRLPPGLYAILQSVRSERVEIRCHERHILIADSVKGLLIQDCFQHPEIPPQLGEGPPYHIRLVDNAMLIL